MEKRVVIDNIKAMADKTLPANSRLLLSIGMSLTNEERRTLVALELKKARDTYEEIDVLTAANRWGGAANRKRIEPARRLIDDIEKMVRTK